MKKNHLLKGIHLGLKKKSPRSVHKVRKIFGFRYPKLFLFTLCIILSYIFFKNSAISGLILGLNRLSYLGIFISGIFLVFGFFAPFSVGFFIVANPENILLASFIGGTGAMIGDMLIFKTIKFSFMDEFEKIKKTELAKIIRKISYKNKYILIRHYLLYLFAGIIIATPLPDEIGISMLAGLTTIKPKILAGVSFIIHTIAIFLILLAGNL